MQDLSSLSKHYAVREDLTGGSPSTSGCAVIQELTASGPQHGALPGETSPNATWGQVKLSGISQICRYRMWKLGVQRHGLRLHTFTALQLSCSR